MPAARNNEQLCAANHPERNEDDDDIDYDGTGDGYEVSGSLWSWIATAGSATQDQSHHRHLRYQRQDAGGGDVESFKLEFPTTSYVERIEGLCTEPMCTQEFVNDWRYGNEIPRVGTVDERWIEVMKKEEGY